MGKLDEAFKDVTSDVVDYGDGMMAPIKGRDSIISMVKGYLSAFPDYKGENYMVVGDGNHVAVFGDYSGTFKNPWMGMKPTGNGRRESYHHLPMPRMTNTFMLAGQDDPEEIVRSVKNGLYAVSFSGGQVDITNGKFVFSASEAYRIEDGKIGAPVRGATLIGNGPEVLTRVSRIGSDMKLDPGIGTCGKDGQGVPVGVGMPTLRIDGITVGGTEG
jgi:predicted ester cyclase